MEVYSSLISINIILRLNKSLNFSAISIQVVTIDKMESGKDYILHIIL